ncbi:MAG: PilZ domain-containing protein [Methylicorpusculum sp.]|uniref:PilZ domain-containing protein n=1 Tax=Methylicorpusculum sp. TaxID=2713644 RepID=UPI002720424C|nr:PilZ domain-containing protein [Methylicorpusculum sp.]MDO8844594.1 PilZ domain-containing protein [Methylicorpusculum sp.]MDO8941423.1 PilZ domain-containing protein [Methylicorpusculum sp.]MDO9239229.1 PilZ domain-containing protein [Methylicorpusculum sp.]MDP2178586.1 PilZ domain-containing protein [Methylicorpusculum sp.]MDP2202987.1 PilZ domain-containing protein [Methylicorpusculum sp.]
MEKKIYPQVSIHLPVFITNVEGIRFKVVAFEMSNDGFAFKCSTNQRNLITPGGCFIHNKRPMELDVRLILPASAENNGSEGISACCHVIYSRRIARDECEIGVRYFNIEAVGYDKLLSFLDSRLVKNVEVDSIPSVKSVVRQVLSDTA